MVSYSAQVRVNVESNAVLILIVVEDGLVRKFRDGREYRVAKVLILIVVEDGLVLIHF